MWAFMHYFDKQSGSQALVPGLEALWPNFLAGHVLGSLAGVLLSLYTRRHVERAWKAAAPKLNAGRKRVATAWAEIKLLVLPARAKAD